VKTNLRSQTIQDTTVQCNFPKFLTNALSSSLFCSIFKGNFGESLKEEIIIDWSGKKFRDKSPPPVVGVGLCNSPLKYKRHKFVKAMCKVLYATI
jgi:hypothetical protein